MNTAREYEPSFDHLSCGVINLSNPQRLACAHLIDGLWGEKDKHLDVC